MIQAQTTATHKIDISELMYPMPIIKVGQSMNHLNSGEVLKISAHGASILTAISAYCARTGNELIEHINDNEEIIFFIRKF